jgi:DNA-binding response OmpR family regulator
MPSPQAGSVGEAQCVVLDLNLPGISGFDFFRRLSSAGTAPPVIVITAHDTDANREESSRLGAAAYLRKPFSGRDLLVAIERALHRQ